MNFGNLIKRHSVLIIAGALGLCAVAVFALTVFMSSNLKGKVETESMKIGKRIRTLSGSVVSSRQKDIESKYQDALEADANAISDFGAQTTMRQLLSYDIFPEPKNSSRQLFDRFGKKYRQSIETLIDRRLKIETLEQVHLTVVVQVIRCSRVTCVSQFDENVKSQGYL